MAGKGLYIIRSVKSLQYGLCSRGQTILSTSIGLMWYHLSFHLCCAVPPVHLVASQIAAVYNLNLDKIKRRLMEVSSLTCEESVLVASRSVGGTQYQLNQSVYSILM